MLPVDGQYLMLMAEPGAGSRRLLGLGRRHAGRQLFARVDLSDDRSFVSSRYRGLVALAPKPSNYLWEGTRQGWIRIGLEQWACEIHVVLDCLSPSIDLILGRCALDLVAAAGAAFALDRGTLDGGRLDRADPANNVVDLKTALYRRCALAG